MSQNVPLYGFGNGNAPTVMQVICNTIRPAKPHEKMIWVNSPNAMTKCTFSGERPSDPVSGEVWLRIGNSGSVKVSTPIGKDWITVYPLSAEQYISFEWVSVPAMSYQYGEWVEWIGNYYYRASGAYKGEWKSVAYKASGSASGTASAPTIIHTSDGMRVTGSTANKIGTAYNDAAIDFSKYSNLKIVGSIDNQCSCSVIVTDVVKDGYTRVASAAFVDSVTSKQTLNIPLSGINTIGYICMNLFAYSVSVGVTIESIELE